MKRLNVAAELPSLPAIHRFVIDAAQSAGLDERAAYRLRLSVEELTTNVMEHGEDRPGDRPATEIELAAELDNAVLRLSVIDDGPPFDPTSKPPPDDTHLPIEERKIGGLGVFLAIDGVDEFHYAYAEARNRVTLIVNRPAPSTAEPSAPDQSTAGPSAGGP